MELPQVGGRGLAVECGPTPDDRGWGAAVGSIPMLAFGHNRVGVLGLHRYHATLFILGLGRELSGPSSFELDLLGHLHVFQLGNLARELLQPLVQTVIFVLPGGITRGKLLLAVPCRAVPRPSSTARYGFSPEPGSARSSVADTSTSLRSSPETKRPAKLERFRFRSDDGER